jgi:hypothetical protein
MLLVAAHIGLRVVAIHIDDVEFGIFNSNLSTLNNQ